MNIGKNTQRTQKSQVMSKEEKKSFIEIIKKMPWLYKPIISKLGSYAKKSKTLIDLGCGDGHLLNIVHKRFPLLDLVGVDIDNFMINIARTNLPFKFYKKDVKDFSEKSDIIISNLSLHHFKDPKKILKKLYSLSKIVLIVSDQLRPSTLMELKRRLRKRKEIIGSKDVGYYKKFEERSILEAYDKDEIIQILDSLQVKYKIFFYDKDYYERFVVIFEK